MRKVIIFGKDFVCFICGRQDWKYVILI